MNYFGTKQGARVQGTLTAVKLLSVASLIGFGLLAPAIVTPDWTAPLPPGNLLAAMGLAIVAILGNFDGWYQATLSAGEIWAFPCQRTRRRFDGWPGFIPDTGLPPPGSSRSASGAEHGRSHRLETFFLFLALM